MAATLNQAETVQMIDIERVMKGVLSEGFDPDNPAHSIKKREIEAAIKALHTITYMKGNYPS